MVLGEDFDLPEMHMIDEPFQHFVDELHGPRCPAS